MSNTVPHLKLDPKAEAGLMLRGKAPFVRECRMALHNLPGFSDFSRSRKELYQDLVMGPALDPLVDRIGWSMDSPGSLDGMQCPFSA